MGNRLLFVPPQYRKASSIPLLVIGEFPTVVDVNANFPFTSTGGKVLFQFLGQEKINPLGCGLTYLFDATPPDHKFDAWCANKVTVSKKYAEDLPLLQQMYPQYAWPATYTWDKVGQGKYLLPEHLHNLFEIREVIAKLNPNVILALGGLVCWALTGEMGIEKVRGTPTVVHDMAREDGSSYKLFPTYHPSALNRNWELATIFAADIAKLARESLTPAIVRPSRRIYVPECREDFDQFFVEHLSRATELSCDIEAHVGKDITCIGFAPSPHVALVVPFSNGPTFDHYWPTLEEEIFAYSFCRRLLCGHWHKTFHNGMFDIQYIIKFWKLFPRNCTDDTMLMQHSLQPELPKSLGFLGTIYTEEASWKIMRTRAKDLAEKKDD